MQQMETQNSFSIVIPLFNSWEAATAAVESVLIASLDFDVEIIVVDDCSTCSSGKSEFFKLTNQNSIKILKTHKNSGPGVARNLGIQKAKKDYIVFLDSDDQLKPNFFAALLATLEGHTKTDVVAFDYELMGRTLDLKVQRYDLDLIADNAFLHYVAHRCDGSVILAIYRRQFIQNNSLEFEEGIFEDLLFMAKVYANCESLKVVPEVLYTKNIRKDAITSSIDETKALTYLANWEKVAKLAKIELVEDRIINDGKAVAAVTRMREVIRRSDAKAGGKILKSIVDRCVKENFSISRTSHFKFVLDEIKLQFGLKTHVSKVSDPYIFHRIKDLMNGYLSCKDLEGSIFLRSNEARACCKRFFVEDARRGDVTLAKFDGDVNKMLDDSFSYREQLIRKINNGTKSECDGCPFIERFNGPIETERKLNYVSIENHSICNLRCTYCSPEYFGGKKETYPISEVMENFVCNDRIESSVNIVWGGGEPSIGPSFPNALKTIENTEGVFHKFITNSVKFSPEIAALLKKNRAQVISSIDSYSVESFLKIRGRDRFNEVFSSVERYAAINPELTTIKYIITEENSDVEGLMAFTKEINNRGLNTCNFQISCNFKSKDIDQALINAACVLFDELVSNRCSYVYFDDLIAARLNKFDLLSCESKSFKAHLFSKLNGKIDVFGHGQHALNLFERFNLISTENVGRFLCTSDFLKADSFLGKPLVAVEGIETLRDVFVASVHDFARVRQILPSQKIRSLIPL